MTLTFRPTKYRLQGTYAVGAYGNKRQQLSPAWMPRLVFLTDKTAVLGEGLLSLTVLPKSSLSVCYGIRRESVQGAYSIPSQTL
jgi:hypothetical protein